MNRVERESGAGAVNESRVLCIVSPRKSAYSETFIANHVAHLPFAMERLYGRPLPCYDQRDRNLLGKLAFLVFLPYLWSDVFGLRAEVLLERFHRLVIGRHLRRKRVRAVLAEYGRTGVAMLGPCRSAGVPMVVHFHGADAYQAHHLEKYGARYRDMFAYAAAIVAVSRDMERQLVTLGAAPEKVHRIVYGIDGNLFQGADPERAPPHFLAVGRFVEKKAPHLTLLALAAVLRDEPAARLSMVGDGPLLGPCQALAEGLGIADRVDFLGVLEPSAVATAMSRSRAFVQHSIGASDGDSEGNPVSILEAQTAGLPVVATRHAGIPEVVIEGETGFLVAERDVAGMAAGMLRTIREPRLAGELGAAGRRRALETYSAQRSLGKLADLVAGVMDR